MVVFWSKWKMAHLLVRIELVFENRDKSIGTVHNFEQACRESVCLYDRIHMRIPSFIHLASKPCGDAGIWTRGLLHAKQALYRWATSPAVEKCLLNVEMILGW